MSRLSNLGANSTILKQKYTLKGMSCQSCESKVRSALLTVPGVEDVSPDKDKQEVEITSEDKVSLSNLQFALNSIDSKYLISLQDRTLIDQKEFSFLQTYIPLIILFAFLLGITLIIQVAAASFDFLVWMRHFMAGFFLSFSFFKLINLEGFANSYRMYDILATRWKAWGYVYPFVELFLGLAYLINFDPIVTNMTALIVMSLSIIGVIQSVLNKRKIQCACLGAVFDLPMSTITIIEDALMIIMSGFMLFNALG